MTRQEPIKIEDIAIAAGRRDADPAAVARLASSLAEIGLLTPIMVRLVDDYVLEDGEVCDGVPVLIAGRHRLEAARSLGWDKIECLIVDMDEIRAELVEIDENLMRAELSPAERAEQTARRKELYLIAHPETGHGANQHTRSRQVGDSTDRFTAETSAKTGQSERKVQRDATRGERISAAAMAQIKADPALNKGVVLDIIAKTRVDRQLDQLEQIRRQRLRASEKSPEEMDLEAFEAIRRVYERARPGAQDLFDEWHAVNRVSLRRRA